MRIVLHDSKQTDELWHVMWPILRRAIVQDFFEDEASLKEKIINGDFHVLMAVDKNIKGISVLEVIRGKMNLLAVQFVAGSDIKDWAKQMDDEVTKFAKAAKCDTVIAMGRKGWGRIWPSYTSTKKELFFRSVE